MYYVTFRASKIFQEILPWSTGIPDCRPKHEIGKMTCCIECSAVPLTIFVCHMSGGGGVIMSCHDMFYIIIQVLIGGGGVSIGSRAPPMGLAQDVGFFRPM